MELHQLRYAVAVADEGTFTAAAARCFVAQPSLSHALKTLERELGVELFHRIGRRTTLTPAGEAFVPAARLVLRDIDALRDAVGSVRGLTSGHLDLVSLPTLAVDPVAPLVGAFRRAYPAITVRLAHPEDRGALLLRVRDGSSEVGITELPLERLAGVLTIGLGHQRFVALLPPGSPRRRWLPVEELAAWPLVTQRSGTSTRDILDAALATAQIAPTVSVETDQREAIIPLVVAGAGAAIVPEPMAPVAVELGAVAVPLRPRLERRLGLVRRHAPLTPAAAAFVAVALDRAATGSGR
jgi:DNA-binding transcriptional LysR family regulator